MELFVKIVNDYKPFTTFTKSSTLDVVDPDPPPENWNIVTDNRDNFSIEVIKTSLFLQKFHLVMVGAG